MARAYLTNATKELDLVGVDLAFSKDLPAASHHTVRFEQTHAGLPVIGGSAALRLGADGRPLVAALDIARGISVDPRPSIDEATAISLALEALGEPIHLAPGVKLAVQPQKDGPGRLVYLVGVLQGSSRERMYIIDAHQAEVVRWYPTAHHALGRVYPINPISTPNTQDLTLSLLDTSNPQRLNGWNGNLAVANYSGGSPSNGTMTATQTLGPNSGADFLYDPPNDPQSSTDAFAQVNTFYHLTRARQFFADQLGVNMSPSSWRVYAIANVLEDNAYYFENAFFSSQGFNGWPNLIALGQASNVDFAVDSDVFIHEFGHYVTHNAIDYNGSQIAFHPQYGLTPWSGSIDEGISDYFACSINGDKVLGEASLGSYARDLSDTSKRCPDDTVGEVHFDGEIIGSVSWSLHSAFDAAVADQLVWGAISLLNHGSSFSDFARGLKVTGENLRTAGKLTSQDLLQMDEILRARGLDDCDHEMEIGQNKPRTFQSMGLNFFGSMIGYSCFDLQGYIGLHSLFHFKVKPIPVDKSLKVMVDFQTMGGGSPNYSIHVQTDSPVSISDQSLRPQNATWKLENINSSYGELVIDENSNPPFDPAKTYYIVIGDDSCPSSRVTVSTNIGFVIPATTSSSSSGGGQGGEGGEGGAGGEGNNGNTGKGEGGSADSGGLCAYQVGSAGSLTAWAGLSTLGLAIAALRRARRRRHVER
ncbi:hypothetical protein [Chondromyces crocatus]|uniref:hypothetical protein n=1 Tax=Chondromyces crocatus TaxID=52 RepID=UPI0012E259F7|nr:hypothetical protein [Chondromyces crocatus]